MPAMSLDSEVTLVMTANRIQVGQVWRKLDSQENFLVTRLYTEALTTFAILRPAGNENASMLRIKVENGAVGQVLPGFSMEQDSDSF